jgi:hypothetical protein
MRRHTLLSLVILFIALTISTITKAQVTEKYSRIKVYASKTQMKDLHAKGVAFDEMAERNDSYFIGDFSSREVALIKGSKLRVEIIIDDLTQDFLKRNKESSVNANDAMRTGGTPPGFSYGSMGGYLTYTQMVEELDELKTMYPNLITAKTSLGTTAEGRQIWMVKISDNPDTDESSEPGVFYGSLYHAREPISMMSLTYFMQFILSKYGTDPEITCLIDNRELYFVPCANPDGYVYNQTTNPNGGGFWRKNRRNNGNGTFGVDLNRNFAYNWGIDNNGSSPTPSAEDYRGPSASSEPEIVSIQDFITANQLTIALNNHTYGNKVIMPFEYNSSATLNETHYNNVAALLTADNGFQYGKQFPLLGYYANGTADDWMYGTSGLYSYTVETSHDSDGFWPAQSKIIPTCEKNLEMNIAAAWGAGNYIRPRVASNLYVSGLTYNLPISITNYGSTLGTLETVSLSISDPRVLLYDVTPILLTGLLPDDTWNIFKNITFSPLATSGTINADLIVTNLEGCIYSIPFSFEYSPDGCFPIPNLWTALDIGLPGLPGSSCLQNGVYTVKGSGIGVQQTSDKFHYMKITSANSVYDIRARVATTQNTAANARAGITISESTAPGSRRVSLLFNPNNNRLEFQSRANTNGSLNIQNVANSNIPKWLRITKTSGNFWNAYYSTDGVNWALITKQKVVMPTNVIAGLMVTSGSATMLNTSTFDNLLVSYNGGTISRSSGSTEAAAKETVANKFTLYPNPSKGVIEIRLPASSADQMISVFDINGKEVYKEMLGSSSYKSINLSKLSNGLYFIRYKEGTKVQYEKFIINK